MRNTLMLLVAFVGLVLSATVAFGDAGIDTDAAVAAFDAGAVEAAAPVLPTDPTEAAFIEDAYGKVKSGQWLEFAAMVVIFLTWGARKWGFKVLKFVGLGDLGKWFSSTDRGGVATAGLIALAGAVAHSLYVGADVDAELLRSTVKVVAEAMGGYTGLRILLGLKSSKPAAA